MRGQNNFLPGSNTLNTPSTPSTKNFKPLIIGGVLASSALLIGGAVAGGVAIHRKKMRSSPQTSAPNKPTNDKSQSAQSPQAPQSPQALQAPQDPQKSPKDAKKRKGPITAEEVFQGGEFRRILDMIKLQISVVKNAQGEKVAIQFCDMGIQLCQVAKSIVAVEKDKETLNGLRAYALRKAWFHYIMAKMQLEKEATSGSLLVLAKTGQLQNLFILFQKAHHIIENQFHQLKNRLTIEETFLCISPLDRALNIVF